MSTILWLSKHASKTFELSFQALLCFQSISNLIQDQETKMWAILNPEIKHMFE